MTKVAPFEPWRQRAALTELADQGAGFLATAEGAAFIEQLDQVVTPALRAKAREAGFVMDANDAINLVLERLLTTAQLQKDNAPIRYAAASENPWGYLWVCAFRWAMEERGTRGFGLEHVDHLASPDSEPNTDLTPLAEVVRLTFATLAPRIDEQYHGDLLELLGWLAANPPQRLSYESVEGLAAHRHCPAFTIGQVTAVMNIAWGGRPRQAQTSLMGQYLVDADWDPASSYTHMRALVYFQAAFRAAIKSSKMLSDWLVQDGRNL